MSEFYDCLFANNDRNALTAWYDRGSAIVRCVFRDNTASDEGWPGYGGAVIIVPVPGFLASISESIFERNVGASIGGGALPFVAASAFLSNNSFLAKHSSSGRGV